MSFLDQVSVLILTYNEVANIGRTLEALQRFPEIVVLDSGSTDPTAEIVARFPNTRLVVRAFDTHAAQWSYGLTQCGLSRDWVLALDADYILSPELVEEMARLAPDQVTGGYRARFRYCVAGRPLRGTLYPPVVVLYRREGARYIQTGHTQRVLVRGALGELRGLIDHDDRKPLSRWFSSQQRYAALEAQHLLAMPRAKLRPADRIRRMAWPAPFLVFFYTLIVKRCILDGWPGWLYVLQRTLAEIMIAIELVEARVRGQTRRV
jgi:glycosyltransferase involved in cell wall biosynthesis